MEFNYVWTNIVGIAQSVYWLATGWTVRGSNSGFGGLLVSMLASGTQDRGLAPDRSRRIFPAGKIHSTPSFVQYQNNKVHDTREKKSGGEIFRTRPNRPWGPPSLLYEGYRVFSGVKAADHPPPLLATTSRMSRPINIHPPPLWDFVACYRANFTFYLGQILI
jgi:hypothetical protein